MGLLADTELAEKAEKLTVVAQLLLEWRTRQALGAQHLVDIHTGGLAGGLDTCARAALPWRCRAIPLNQ